MEFKLENLRKNISPYYVFIDTEVTSSSLKHGEVISLGCVVAKGDTLEIVDQFTGYARPKTFDHWNWYAEKEVHHISKATAAKFPEARETAIKLLQFLKPFKNEDNSPVPFVYHGKNKFDYKMLELMFKNENLEKSFYKVFSQNYVLSTCEMFVFITQLFGMEVSDHKLNTMAQSLDIVLNHHEVVSDTLACYEGYKKMRKVFNI